MTITTTDPTDEHSPAPIVKAPQRAEPEIVVVISHEKMYGDGEVLDVGRGRRFFGRAQKKAAAVRDLSCLFADRDKPIRYADYHHCIPWADGGLTDIGNAGPTCNGCHDLLTNHGYRLERRNGTTYTYAPDGQLIRQRNNRGQQ
ncbi:MAG TPA: HNH endonuclease signature motif containing protein [Acidimicrobiales bacterium]|nr:HNH endonuclease signature motif containing protein [Acidimicrobiales bacterium]